jgi:hypothetical protein
MDAREIIEEQIGFVAITKACDPIACFFTF